MLLIGLSCLENELISCEIFGSNNVKVCEETV